MKRFWPIGLVAVLTGVCYVIWRDVLNAPTEAVITLSLVAVLVGLVAAVFGTYSAILQTAAPDVWVRVQKRTGKTIEVSTVAENGVVLLDLGLVNRGSKTSEKTYLWVSAPEGIVIETHAVHRQAPRGLPRVVEPDLRSDSRQPNTIEGWIDDAMWPGTPLDLGEHNQLKLTVPGPGTYNLVWEAFTDQSKRKGTIKLNVKPPVCTN